MSPRSQKFDVNVDFSQTFSHTTISMRLQILFILFIITTTATKCFTHTTPFTLKPWLSFRIGTTQKNDIFFRYHEHHYHRKHTVNFMSTNIPEPEFDDEGIIEQNNFYTMRRKREKLIPPQQQEKTMISSNSQPQVIQQRGKNKQKQNDMSNNDDKTPPPPSLLSVLIFPSIDALNKYSASSRAVEERSYARKEPFMRKNLINNTKPNFEDLLPPPPSPQSSQAQGISSLLNNFFSSSARTFRVSVGIISFPILKYALENFLSLYSQTPASVYTLDLEGILSNFVPGVSIIYGTFISLTLSQLYDRIKCVTEEVTKETSLLSVVTRNLLKVFHHDEEKLVLVAEYIWDQVQILVSESRRVELMDMMEQDPYGGILDLITEAEEDIYYSGEKSPFTPYTQVLISTRNIMQEVITARGARLSAEALTLPPYHFLLLTTLTALLLSGFVLSDIVKSPSTGTSLLPFSISDSGDIQFQGFSVPSFIFSVLYASFILFNQIAQDFNNPFVGYYQVRRSGIAVYLIEIKLLLLGHPTISEKVKQFDEFSIVEDDFVVGGKV